MTNANDTANTGHGTMTILVTRKVTKIKVGGRVTALPEGVTNVNASDWARRFVRATEYTWGFAGTAEDSTMIVVVHRSTEKWAETGKRLNLAIEALGGDKVGR